MSKPRSSIEWHIGADTTEAQQAELKCPFQITPEQKDHVPAKFTNHLKHLVSGQKATTISSPQGAILKEQLAPWTGYFVILNGALLSVSNYVGVWFEVRARGAGWEAFCIARDSLGL